MLSLVRPMLPSVGGFATSSDGFFFFSFGSGDLAMRHDSVTFQMGYHMIHFLVFSGKVLHLAHYKD